MISNWSNLLARKDLLRELVRSELRSSTAETKLGWLWWFLDPLLLMLIYWAIVVGILGRGKEQYAPYPVFLLCAIITWKHFPSAAGNATKILRGREPLIKAVPFPTMVLPIAQVAEGTDDAPVGRDAERRAVYGRHRRGFIERGRRLRRTRGEMIERPLAHHDETEAMHRTHSWTTPR